MCLNKDISLLYSLSLLRKRVPEGTKMKMWFQFVICSCIQKKKEQVAIF